MIENLADIASGMEVYASNGDKLGTINHVWPQATDAATSVMTDGYFSVHEGGVLGLGGKDLYVPFGAVDDCVPGECVTLNVTKDDAETQFIHKPDFLASQV
jgi:hypothetical protein